MNPSQQRRLIETLRKAYSVRQICETLGFNKSTFYYQPKVDPSEDILRDEIETLVPLGIRPMDIGASEQELHKKVRELTPNVLKGETTGHFQLQLASSIKPGISTYKKLEDTIFGDDNIATEVINECIESEKIN